MSWLLVLLTRNQQRITLPTPIHYPPQFTPSQLTYKLECTQNVRFKVKSLPKGLSCCKILDLRTLPLVMLS